MDGRDHIHFSEDGECEITSLDSLREGQGLGTKLIDAVVEEARKQNCRRVFLITTNDNLNALGFYQKRGFEMVSDPSRRGERIKKDQTKYSDDRNE